MPQQSLFKIEIKNLDKLIAALNEYPDISKPILNQAIHTTANVLAKYTVRGLVPWKTGRLTKSFISTFEDLKAIWRPTAEYASAVQTGTKPHIIMARNKKYLYWKGANHPVKSVKHPGTKGQDYMGKIRDAAKPEIDQVFDQALQAIVRKITLTTQ